LGDTHWLSPGSVDLEGGPSEPSRFDGFIILARPVAFSFPFKDLPLLQWEISMPEAQTRGIVRVYRISNGRARNLWPNTPVIHMIQAFGVYPRVSTRLHSDTG
jgi:hypothetical protein